MPLIVPARSGGKNENKVYPGGKETVAGWEKRENLGRATGERSCKGLIRGFFSGCAAMGSTAQKWRTPFVEVGALSSGNI